MLVEDGRIAAVGSLATADTDVVDARGCLVLPGGVDVHAHPLGAIEADTAAALLGGTTTILGFVDAEPGESPAAARSGRSPTSCPGRAATSACTAWCGSPRRTATATCAPSPTSASPA